MIVCTDTECPKCQYGTLDDSNKARLKVYCANKEKEIYYGKMIDCDNYAIKKATQ